MKKIVFLSIAIAATCTAFAQGKVGIGTTTPNATLDIKPSATAPASSNQGILIPRLSKTRAASMTTPEESTLIYINDTAYSGNATTVSQVNNRGFFFWSGTKWVQHGNVNGSIWKYENGKVYIDDSSITDRVEYLKEGGYRHLPKNMRGFDVVNSDLNNTYNLNFTYSDLVKGNFTATPYPQKTLAYNRIEIDSMESSTIKRFYAANNVVVANSSSNKQIDALYGAVNASSYQGKDSLYSLIGAYNYGGAGSPDSPKANLGRVGFIRGAYNQANVYLPSNIFMVDGAYNYLTARGTGGITYASATRNQVNVLDGSNAFQNLTANSNAVIVDSVNYTGSIKTLMGVDIGFDMGSNFRPTNMYGLYLYNVNKGSAKNYAVYTNLGKSSFGDTFEVRKDGWLGNQEAVLQFKNGANKNVPTSQIIDKMNGAGDGGSNLVFTTQSSNLGTNPNQIAPTEKMRIAADGNVGIGTNNPIALLTMQKDQPANDNEDNVTLTSYSNTSTPSYVIQKYMGTLASPQPVTADKNIGTISMRGYNGTILQDVMTLRGVAETDFATSPKTALSIGLHDGANLTEKMRITSVGNIGIGTSTPSEKLEVSGKVKAANVIFTGIPTYATDAAAGTGGLVSGEMYKTATGELRIKL